MSLNFLLSFVKGSGVSQLGRLRDSSPWCADCTTYLHDASPCADCAAYLHDTSSCCTSTSAWSPLADHSLMIRHDHQGTDHSVQTWSLWSVPVQTWSLLVQTWSLSLMYNRLYRIYPAVHCTVYITPLVNSICSGASLANVYTLHTKSRMQFLWNSPQLLSRPKIQINFQTRCMNFKMNCFHEQINYK